MTRIVGKRRPRPITREPSGELLREGALFNDELHRLPTGATTWFPKGVYRYRTHEEANAHWERCVIEGMARHALRSRTCGPEQTRHSRPATLDDLKRLVRALNERGAEHILVGGYAMFAHGHHRATEDIDLLAPARREAARPILDALLVLAGEAAADVPEAWFEEGENIRLADEIVVDLLFASCGETYESLRPHVKVVEVEGVPVRTLDLDGLLKTKRSARGKDRMDRAGLERALPRRGRA